MLRTKTAELLCGPVTVSASVDQYYVTYTFRTKFRIPFDEVLYYEANNSTIELHVLNEQLNDGNLYYTCVDPTTYKLLKSSFRGFTGNASLRELCNYEGIPCSVNSDTPPQYWSFQACNLQNFIETVNEQLNFSLSAPRVFLGVSGSLSAINFSQALKTKPATAPITITDRDVSTDWRLVTPSSIEIVHYSLTDIKTYTLQLYDGFSSARMYINDTTGKAFDQYVNQATNEFMLKFFTAQRYTATVGLQTPFINLGTHIQSINGEVHGIVTSSSFTNDGTQYSQRITFALPLSDKYPSPKLTPHDY